MTMTGGRAIEPFDPIELLEELVRIDSANPNMGGPGEQEVAAYLAHVLEAVEQRDPTLRADLEALIKLTSRGDPESPLRWTTRSVRNLAAEFRRQGHTVGTYTCKARTEP